MIVLGFTSTVTELLTAAVIVHVGRVIPLLADVALPFCNIAAGVVSLGSKVKQAMIFSVWADNKIAWFIVVPPSVDVMNLCSWRQWPA
jgi:hypothetical protein